MMPICCPGDWPCASECSGHKVKYVSVTNGNKGHYKDDPITLAKRRYEEA